MKDEDVVKMIATWPAEIVVTPEVRNQKYDICQSCDLFNSVEKTCTVCKCEMNLLTWSRYMGTCPKGKFKGE